jgi:hypothetical protein
LVPLGRVIEAMMEMSGNKTPMLAYY